MTNLTHLNIDTSFGEPSDSINDILFVLDQAANFFFFYSIISLIRFVKARINRFFDKNSFQKLNEKHERKDYYK